MPPCPTDAPVRRRAHELQFATGGKLGTHRNDVYRLARAVHGKQGGKDFAILRFVKHFGAQLPAYKHHSGTSARHAPKITDSRSHHED